jgi:CheY-like chemotaxis protein
MPMRVIPEKVLSHMQSGHFQRITPITSASAPQAELPTLASMVSDPPVEEKPPQKHVLIVEDNLVNQKVLAKQLRTIGYAVHVANHGQEALNFLEKSRFWHDKAETGIPLDVILMDLEMPVMNGLTAVKNIRTLQMEGKVLGHVPTLCLTANARSAQIDTAREAGMDSVVTKPFRIPDLVPEIERWCSPGDMKSKATGAENHMLLPSGL